MKINDTQELLDTCVPWIDARRKMSNLQVYITATEGRSLPPFAATFSFSPEDHDRITWRDIVDYFLLELRLWQLYLKLLQFFGLLFRLEGFRNQSQSRCRRPSSKYLVFSWNLLGFTSFGKVLCKTREMIEKISYTSVIKNTLREVLRKLSGYFTASQSYFSTEGNNLDLCGLYSGLQHAQTNFEFVTSVKKGQRQ